GVGGGPDGLCGRACRALQEDPRARDHRRHSQVTLRENPATRAERARPSGPSVTPRGAAWLKLKPAPRGVPYPPPRRARRLFQGCRRFGCTPRDRKSTRLNSSHVAISYAVFCLKKKKTWIAKHPMIEIAA